MFNEKYIVDAVVAIIALWISIGVWGNEKMKGLFKTIVIAVALGTAVLWINSRHGFLHGASSSTQVLDGAKVTGKGFVSKIPWLRIVLAGLVGVLTFWHAKRVGMPKSWLGDKRDQAAFWATLASGSFLALSVLIGASIWSLLTLFLAVASLVSIMNVQVPEQELWTPKLFGKRCFNSTWMLGNYCFANGFNWMLLPRNTPGLSFNVAKPRTGVPLKCITAKVPTKGFKIPGTIDAIGGEDVFMVGGEVDVPFTLILQTHDDLDAYYSSQDDLRSDQLKLTAYASEIYGAEFRELLKNRNLDDIQTGTVFEGRDFAKSRRLFEAGTGHKVTKYLIEDATPSKEVQDRINALAAKRIEKVQAMLEAEIEATKKGGIGKGRLAELQPLIEALLDPVKGNAVREAVAAVRSIDFAAHSNLRVLVEKELGPLMPLVAEAAED